MTEVHILSAFIAKYKSIFIAMLVALCAALGVMAFSRLAINNLNYIFFSVTFFCLLAVGFVKPVSEFLVLFNGFLFLGFWMKATLYLLTLRLRGDFIGSFTIETFNDSILIAGVGAFCLFMVQFILKYKVCRFLAQGQEGYRIKVPSFYSIFFLGMIILISFLNYRLGFFQVGITTSFALYLPFSLMFYWLLGPGSSFIVFLLTTTNGYNIFNTLMVAVTMSAVSISTISRNTLMYFAFPVFVKFIFNIKMYKTAVLHSALILVFFIISLFGISQLRRSAYYPENAARDSQYRAISHAAINWKYTTTSTAQVFLDRWIGLEGVIVAKIHQSDINFKTLAMEDSKLNRVSLYSYLSGSFYPTTGKYLFYTSPGPLGLLAFAKSMQMKIISWTCFLSVLILSYVIIEFFFFGLSKSAVSWWAASTMSQISLFPLYNLKIYFSYLVIMLFCLFIMHKFKFIKKS